MSRDVAFSPRQARMLYASAFVWGLAEGTLFFVVPDVLLTWIALHDRRRALAACLAALTGALCAGALMSVLGQAYPHAMHVWLDRVPAVSPRLIDEARAAMQQHGGLALITGAFSGVPYKLFAAQAQAAGLNLPALLAWTVPARLSRFVLLSLLTSLVAHGLRPRTRRGAIVGLWALAWIINYALYWSLMPS